MRKVRKVRIYILVYKVTAWPTELGSTTPIAPSASSPWAVDEAPFAAFSAHMRSVDRATGRCSVAETIGVRPAARRVTGLLQRRRGPTPSSALCITRRLLLVFNRVCRARCLASSGLCYRSRAIDPTLVTPCFFRPTETRPSRGSRMCQTR